LTTKQTNDILSEREISHDIKVLLCSGYGREQYSHELFEAGADNFLQKPFHHSELLRGVAETMGG
jgi:DNA-binding response OmpR family regulator